MQFLPLIGCYFVVCFCFLMVPRPKLRISCMLGIPGSINVQKPTFLTVSKTSQERETWMFRTSLTEILKNNTKGMHEVPGISYWAEWRLGSQSRTLWSAMIRTTLEDCQQFRLVESSGCSSNGGKASVVTVWWIETVEANRLTAPRSYQNGNLTQWKW